MVHIYLCLSFELVNRMAINYRHVRNYVRSLPNQTVVPDRLLRKPQNLKVLELLEFAMAAFFLFLWFALDVSWNSLQSIAYLSNALFWAGASVLLGIEDYRYRAATSIATFSTVGPMFYVGYVHSAYFMFAMGLVISLYPLSLYLIKSNIAYYKWTRECAGKDL